MAKNSSPVVVGEIEPAVEAIAVPAIDPARANLRDTFIDLIKHYPDDVDGNRHAATIPLTVAHALVAIEPFASDPQWRAVHRSIDENANFRSFEIGVEYVRSIIRSI